MFRSKTLPLLLCMVALTAFVACGTEPEPAEPMAAEPMESEPMEEPMEEPGSTASAELQGAEGSGISGRITFTETATGTSYEAEVRGVARAGLHGFHIHETGECAGPDFTSAGGHFNPTGVVHGGPNDIEHHAGDLGNIEIQEDGTGTLSGTSSMITLGGGANSVVGKAVILHEGEDDLESQPTGDAGGRLACGVIHPES